MPTYRFPNGHSRTCDAGGRGSCRAAACREARAPVKRPAFVKPPVVGAIAALVCLGPRVAAQSADSPAVAGLDSQRTRPAVLLLPVWERSDPRPPSGRVEVVEPGGGRRLARTGDGLLRRAAARPPVEWQPFVGSDYVAVQSFQPNPLWPQLRYCVYLNLSDPAAVRHWRELNHAHYRAARRVRAEEQGLREWERRKQRLLTAAEQAAEEGLIELRAGQYRSAIIALTRAAQLNHGDPACRVYLALARVAVGHDAEAAAALRAALELQPRLAPARLDLEDYYPEADDLARHTAALERRLAARPDASPDEHLLLGFLEAQLGRLDAAHAALRRARRGPARDDVLDTLLSVTKPVAVNP